MTTETASHGRSVDSIVEGAAGGVFHRAVLLSDLSGTLYAVHEEFSYDDTEEAQELVRRTSALMEHLELLSISEKAELTVNRTCDACGGDGKDWRLQEPERSVNPCEDCNGTGWLASRQNEET